MPITEFHDKSGKSLYTGDLVQWRLGTFGKKSGGPTTYRVRLSKKGVRLAHPDSTVGGFLIRKNQEQYISLLDTSDREK